MKPFTRTDRDGWWVRYKGADGRWRTCKGGDSEGAAYVTLARIDREATAIREGWVDARQVEAATASRRPIADIIAEHRLYLMGKRNTPKHVAESTRCITAVVAGIGAKCLADIDYGRVETWLAALLDMGRSARTRNVYLMRLNGMLNWAVRRRMVMSNPLMGIETVAEQCDRREVSRAMTHEEVARLLAATPCSRRRLFYLTAVRTGLRWSEITRLRWSNVDLDTGWVTPYPSGTKSKRDDPVPLAPDLADGLRAWRAACVEASAQGKASGRRDPSDLADVSQLRGRVFRSTPILRTFQNDLARAGIPYETDRGQADRKGLRKTFGTHLFIAKVDFCIVVQLMRHSDPRLTMNIYTDPALLDMKAAVERLGDKPVTNGGQIK